MSNLRLPNTASPASASPIAGANQGVLGLGVDVGVVQSPGTLSGPEAATPLPDRQPADRYASESTPKAGAKETETREPVRNPFEGLSREARALEERRVAASEVGLDKELDPELALLQRMAHLEGRLGPASGEAFRKTRLGLMLLTADGQGPRAARVPIPAPQVESLAKKILARGAAFGLEDHRAFLAQNARYHGAIAGNIQAYVQRVLRECYLLQNDILADYAAKVRHYNDMKKKIREVLTKARETRSGWASGDKDPSTFLADKPFTWLEVGDDGELFTPKMTQEDVERWQAQARAAAQIGHAGGTAAGLEAVYGPSVLSADDLETLTRLGENRDFKVTEFWKGNRTDNYIAEHIDELLPLIPKMNKADLDKYLVPIIGHLSKGNAEESELLQIFGALTPVQFLAMTSGVQGFTDAGEPGGMDVAKGAGAGAAAGAALGIGVLSAPLAVVGAAIGALYVELGSKGGLNDEEMDEFNQIAHRAGRAVAEAAGLEFSGDLTADKAKELLVALRAKTTGQGEGANGSVPVVGSEKEIRTMQGMEDYIKTMEDKLNSIGEDAQLANVDLQNALQQQQQTLQMLSNISKVLHDTALAIVRRIAG